MPSNLIPLEAVGKEMRVDSRIIAERLGIDHKSLMKNIYRFEDALKQAGEIIYLTENKKKKGKRFSDSQSINLGGRPEKYAALNEPQANIVGMLSTTQKE